MPGPTIPGFYGRGQMPDMNEKDAIKSEQGYYGVPTPEMREGPPLEALPSNLWKRYPNIDLSQPTPDARTDPETQDFFRENRKMYEGKPRDKAFIDRIEEGYAVVEMPGSEDTITVRAQPGWKEGMHIDPASVPNEYATSTVHMPERPGIPDRMPYDDPHEGDVLARPRSRSRKRRAVP